MFWPKVRRSLQFHERTRYWWQPGQHQSVVAYNHNEKRKIRSIRQYGGTAQISRENASLCIQAYGEDPSGLRRWVRQLYRGANKKQLRVIMAYHPNASPGPCTVFAQH